MTDKRYEARPANVKLGKDTASAILRIDIGILTLR
jgi:hypothetical protein